MTPQQFVDFVLLLFRNKRHPRVGWQKCTDEEGRALEGRFGVHNPEHVLGHTGGVALLVLLSRWVPTFMNNVNSERCMDLALVHDVLPEWKDGDTNGHYVGTEEERRRRAIEKHLAEERAVAEILKHTEEYAAITLRDMWAEYCDGATPEARLVKQLDKIEFLLQALAYYLDGERIQLDMFLVNVRERVSNPWLSRVIDEIEYRAKKEGGHS